MLRSLVSCLAACILLAAADQPPAIVFMDAAHARTAIVDESVEPYFSLLQTQEMSSKTGAAITGADLAAQRDECRRRYQAAVREFTPEEQAALTAAITSVQPLLAKQYPLFAAEPWSFIKIDRAFEGGMPHTRGHSIVLSDDGLMRFPRGGAAKLNPAGVNLLVHEQTHVVQRLHPKPFAALYTQSWGLVRMPAEPTPSAAMRAHQLVNPDGIACVWAFPVVRDGKRRLIEPQVIFGSDAAVPRMPMDFSVIAISVEQRGDAFAYAAGTDGAPETVPLEAVPEYLAAFAPSEENFHPNEVCAELFSRMVTLDLLGKRLKESPCQVRLRAWAQVQLQLPKPAP